MSVCDPMDCSPPGSSVHGVLQAIILEWVAIPSSRGSSRSRKMSPALAGRFFTTSASWEALLTKWIAIKSSSDEMAGYIVRSALQVDSIYLFILKAPSKKFCPMIFEEKRSQLKFFSFFEGQKHSIEVFFYPSSLTSDVAFFFKLKILTSIIYGHDF